MRQLRFTHVFAALMVLAGLCAFALPARVSDRLRHQVRVLFVPVSWPTHKLGGWIVSRVAPERLRDDGAPNPDHPRNVRELVEENQELRQRLLTLKDQLARAEQREAERETIGDVRRLCKPFSVTGTGGDSALRESLLISGSTRDGVAFGQPVLFGGIGGGGIAGRIFNAVLGGSQVQLITDRGFKARVGFARFITGQNGQPDFVVVATPQVLAEGDGQGHLWIRNLPMTDAKSADLRPNDWVILNDEEWPDILQRYRLGKIDSIRQRPNGPLFAEIKVEPPTNLMNLREVMVMVKNQ
jgi:cell shape-determining protein MreC